MIEWSKNKGKKMKEYFSTAAAFKRWKSQQGLEIKKT